MTDTERAELEREEVEWQSRVDNITEEYYQSKSNGTSVHSAKQARFKDYLSEEREKQQADIEGRLGARLAHDRNASQRVSSATAASTRTILERWRRQLADAVLKADAAEVKITQQLDAELPDAVASNPPPRDDQTGDAGRLHGVLATAGPVARRPGRTKGSKISWDQSNVAIVVMAYNRPGAFARRASAMPGRH